MLARPSLLAPTSYRDWCSTSLIEEYFACLFGLMFSRLPPVGLRSSTPETSLDWSTLTFYRL